MSKVTRNTLSPWYISCSHIDPVAMTELPLQLRGSGCFFSNILPKTGFVQKPRFSAQPDFFLKLGHPSCVMQGPHSSADLSYRLNSWPGLQADT